MSMNPEELEDLQKTYNYQENLVDLRPIVKELVAELQQRDEHLADIRNKYGQLHTFWEVIEHVISKDEDPAQLMRNSAPRMILANERFVTLLKED